MRILKIFYILLALTIQCTHKPFQLCPMWDNCLDREFCVEQGIYSCASCKKGSLYHFAINPFTCAYKKTYLIRVFLHVMAKPGYQVPLSNVFDIRNHPGKLFHCLLYFHC